MKTTNSQSFQPSIPKPRSFSQTTAAPKMTGGSTPMSVSRGTTGGGKGHTTGPLSVPRAGCCGKT